jgi:hypothetical protein
MTSPRSVELNASQATTLLQQTLDEAVHALQAGNAGASFDNYASALGLALQLGPAPTEGAILAILEAADHLAKQQDSKGLGTLGPALVSLVDQVRSAGALPATPIMNTWAAVALELGTLVGQVGLALAIPPQRRSEMMANARARATLLDEATHGHFALADWLDRIPTA